VKQMVMLLGRKSRADLVVTSLDFEGNVYTLGCKFQDLCNELKVYKSTSGDIDDISYVFVSPEAIEFRPQNDAMQLLKNLFKLEMNPKTQSILGISLNGMVVSVPRACIINAAYKYALLKCALEPVLPRDGGDIVSEPIGLGLDNSFELNIVIDLNNVLELLERSRIPDLVKHVPFNCELLAYIYQLLNDWRKCIEEFASTLLKAIQCVINYNTKKLIQILPNTPEEEISIFRTLIEFGHKISPGLGHEYIQMRRPRRDRILEYLSLITHGITDRLPYLCSFPTLVNVVNEFLRAIEESVEVLANFINDKEMRVDIKNSIVQHINEVEYRCYERKNDIEKTIQLYDQLYREVLVKKCDTTLQDRIEALAQRGEEMLKSICIRKRIPLIMKAISNSRYNLTNRTKIMLVI